MSRQLLEAVRIRIGVAIGLLFLIGPLESLGSADLSHGRTIAIVALTAGFVAVYALVLPGSSLLEPLGRAQVWGPLAALAALTCAILALGAPDAFVTLFVYVVAAAGIRLRVRDAVAVIIAVEGAALAAMLLGDAAGGTIASLAIVILSIGAMMAAFGRKIAANRELHLAREELAVLAVSEERLRIARDLHDLLGHSLSVIALKSDLAGRLVDRDPEAARREIDDIRTVTRDALAEVREAVQGYRRQALGDELARAESALAAAGISCELQRPARPLPADVEAVLAWAVREGTTNVVRHSGAARCSIRVEAGDDVAAVQVDDDGSPHAAGTGAGNGLTGLAERAERLRGTLEAGELPAGGFRLRLSVPLPGA